ncbi:2-amino-4-hydroxy-6-hydroxymethyldihydropteridine diphosphokinase [Szabonella alba]|uniref:2-amino-4-hydroxy-6-hydroxymethyldihydropteridine pyrophosphokinase n=1 Tax=Szabonella alba TaxID=2804194 RepID=A0A8K0VER4_9RHOB|nr:2-amino-4-hydroxy-6-hydroxymethyldihydropteridine diphosphokinase [Szabonella alba]MBL4918440.1 2-amino-4-hydroxy-6-hydroxymethyldihydropteridine diphosphokinase [Szabonella alba]
MTSVAAPILVAFGANLPNDAVTPARQPAATLRAALTDLAAEGLRLRLISPFYATPCFPAGAGPDYVNAVAAFDPPLTSDAATDPVQILDRLHRVEARHARLRISRWAGRTLDLDLLAMGDRILPDVATESRWRLMDPALQRQKAPDRLILPHPRIADRAFVLVPLCDVAPDWRHPATGLTATDMLNSLPQGDRDAVRRLD